MYGIGSRLPVSSEGESIGISKSAGESCNQIRDLCGFEISTISNNKCNSNLAFPLVDKSFLGTVPEGNWTIPASSPGLVCFDYKKSNRSAHQRARLKYSLFFLDKTKMMEE